MTLLETINNVLLDISEPEVATSGETVASKRAKRYLENAFIEMSTAYDWSWLKSIINGSSLTWNSERATVPLLRKIVWVKLLLPSGVYTQLQYVTPEYFYTQPITPYTTAGNFPECYTVVDTDIYFNPYPNNADERNRIRVFAVTEAQFPIVDGASFPVTDRFLKLLEHKALYYMATNHVHDRDLAQFHLGMYDRMLDQYMSQERNENLTDLTMRMG